MDTASQNKLNSMGCIHFTLRFETMLAVTVSGLRLKLQSSYKPLSPPRQQKASCFLLLFSFHEWITSVMTAADKGTGHHLIEFPVNLNPQDSKNNSTPKFTVILQLKVRSMISTNVLSAHVEANRKPFFSYDLL